MLPLPAALAVLLTVTSSRAIAPSAFVPAGATAPVSAPLALVVEEGSLWNEPGVLEGVLGKASAIFGQCGVSLGETQVVVVKWSPEGLALLNDENPYHGPAQMNVMGAGGLPSRRPIGFLFGPKSVPSTAEAYNRTSVEFFQARYPAAAGLLDTFWITSDQQTRPRRKDEAATFSIFAHELTHILGDLKHTDAAPNLMTNSETPGAKSGDLLPEQCDAVRRLQ